MNDVVVASSRDDALAAEAIEEHHARMAGELALAAERVAGATRAGRPVEEDRRSLLRWCTEELLPHALAEEATLYAAAAGLSEARLLVEAMLAEHRQLAGLVDELEASTEPVAASGLARALRAVFEIHLAKENERLVPLLVAAPSVSLAGLLEGMHETLGGEETGSEGPESGEDRGAGHGCACGEVDGPELPVLDARSIPHAIRHATVFGALDGLREDRGLVLLAGHDPLPLLAQLERRSPGVFEVTYLERGPEAWRLRLVRRRAEAVAASLATGTTSGRVDAE